MAEYEADQTGERIDLVNEYKVKTGQPLVGQQSLGIAYTVEKDEHGVKKVVKDKATEQIVMDYINYYEIHQNKRQAFLHINNKYGTSYSYNTLSKILNDTKIYGHYRGNDFYCEPYISKERFDRLQEIQESNVKMSKTKRVYLFSGLLVCPECGRKMAGAHNGSQTVYKKSGKVYKYNREYHVYRCNRAGRENTCNYRRYASESTLENTLLLKFNAFVQEYIDVVKVEDTRQVNERAKELITELKSEMTRLNTMYRKNRITEEQYDRDYDELEEKLREAESKAEPFEERDLSTYEELLKSDWKDIYNALTRDNKRAFWRKYIKEIHLDSKGHIEEVIFF